MDWMRVPKCLCDRLADLTGGEVKVLLALAFHTPEDDDLAMPPQTVLAKQCGMTRRGLLKALDLLEKRGAVSRVQRAGEPSEYRIEWETCELGFTPLPVEQPAFSDPHILARYWWEQWIETHGVEPVTPYPKQFNAATRLLRQADLERLKRAVDFMLTDDDEWVQRQPRDLAWLERNATRYARATRAPTKAMVTVARSHATLSAAVERARNGNDHCREYPDAARPALPDGDTR